MKPIVLLALTACGGGGSHSGTPTGATDSGLTPATPITVAPGWVGLCAGTESATAGYGPIAVTGTAVEQGALGASGAPVDTAPFQPGWANCDTSASARYLTLRDGAGDLWHFGWTVEDGAGNPLAPTLDLAVDDPVEVDFTQYLINYSMVSGLSVRSGGVLVGAFALSADEDEPLDTTQLGGLGISRGAAMGQSLEPCGLTEWSALDFAGDQTVSVDAGATGSVPLGGVDYTARALSSWTLIAGNNCTDNAQRVVSYAVWR